jgi:hypothetical protein
MTALAALEPLTSLSSHELSHLPADPGKVVMRTYSGLPEHPQLPELLNAAIDLTIELTERLLQPGSSQGDTAALLAISRRPRELRAEVARGLGNETPAPVQARDALLAAADRLRTVLVRRWDQLPIVARYMLVADAAYSTGTPNDDLNELIQRGDPVAVSAHADDALAPLLTVLPVDTDGLDLAATAAGDAITLLATAAQLDWTRHWEHIEVFARTAGNHADPTAVLEALQRHFTAAATLGSPPPLVGLPFLLAGVAEQHPREVTNWLQDGLSRSDPAFLAARAAFAELAASVLDDLPPDLEDTLTRELTALATSPPDIDTEQGPEAELAATATRVTAQHALHCHRDRASRLELLAVLGTRGPLGNLNDVVLRVLPFLRPEAPEDPAVLSQLVDVLARSWTHTDQDPLPDPHDHADELLLALVPRSAHQISELVVERLRDLRDPYQALPATAIWHLRHDATAAPRELIGVALRAQLETTPASDLTDTARGAGLDLLHQLGSDQP